MPNASSRPVLAATCLFLLAACSASPRPGPEPAPSPAAGRGLSPTLAAWVERIDQSLVDEVSATRIDGTIKRLTGRFRMAGNPGSLADAETLRARLTLAGLDARIDSYEALIPWPKDVQVELLSPVAFRPTLRAEPVDADFSTHDTRAPDPFVAFSPEGEVTGNVVYGNRCRRADLEYLGQRVALRGAIVVARFGGPAPGIKAQNAWEAGAAGLILYSDPSDDGYRQGDVYPAGPFRPESSARRATALHPDYPGDLMTPDGAAVRGARRVGLDEVRGVAPIPVVTVSARDVSPFLESLGGPTVPGRWQGGLPFTYHLGGGARASVASLRTSSDWRVRRIFNVVATLRGSAAASERIVICAGRDALGRGAGQGGTQTAALLEAATALGALAKAGRPPSRTLEFCSFDGEAMGRIGSTEHFQDPANLEGVVSIIELGAALGPQLDLAASPLLLGAITSAFAGDPHAPRVRPLAGPSPSPNADRDHGAYEPFLHGAAIPTIVLAAHGLEGPSHSVFDTYGWLRRFGDPGFARTAEMARRAAALAWSLGSATLLPFDHVTVATAVRETLTERDLTALEAISVADGTTPEWEARQSLSDLVQGSARRLQRAAEEHRALRARVLATDPDPTRLVGINQRLARLPKVALDERPGLWRNVLLGAGREQPETAIWLPECTGQVTEGAARKLLAVLNDYTAGLGPVNAALQRLLVAP